MIQISRVVQSLVLLFFFIASLSACAGEPSFRLEATSGATVYTTEPLPAGAKLTFSSKNMKPNEVFLLQKCGANCNSAKVTRTLRMADFEANRKQEVTLTETGSYYFWILQTLENGEVGPVFVVKLSLEGLKGSVTFYSGTSLAVEVELHPAAE